MATVKLERAEELALERMVQAGLFVSKDEAARAAIVKYAMDLGIIRREELWKGIEGHKRRGVTPEKLMKELEDLEDET